MLTIILYFICLIAAIIVIYFLIWWIMTSIRRQRYIRSIKPGQRIKFYVENEKIVGAKSYLLTEGYVLEIHRRTMKVRDCDDLLAKVIDKNDIYHD